jgi:hypothetical protein
MPEHVWELEDDEYRNLAASVRDAGGFKKLPSRSESFRGQASSIRTYRIHGLTTNP